MKNTAKKIIILFLVTIFIFNCKKNDYTAEGKEELINAPYKNPNLSTEERINDLMSRMTLREKIGQMTQIDRSFLMKDSDIAKYNLGSVLCGGGSGPEVFKNPKNWKNISDTYQKMTFLSRLEIPILYGIDAIHGQALVKNTVVFPHNIGMGCTRNPELVEKAARITALEVTATGFNWSFSPCVAVARDEHWGRTYESYSEDPDIVNILGASAVKGYQGNDLSNPQSILACVKHFAGDGGTVTGLDRGDTQIDEKSFRDIHILPYLESIKNNAGSIMASHSSWNGVKMHEHKYLLTDVLKNELGFKGFIVSDWGSVNDLVKDTNDQKVSSAINAGIDMVMVPDNYPKFINTLTGLVEKGEVPISRIDDAVIRILKIKFKMGLFENRFIDDSLLKLVGSKEHREAARQCVRESVVLLKNESGILPLSKSLKRIHVAGSKADDIGYQCGGWTLGWQGDIGNITKGTTILKGIKEAVSSKTKITYSKDGKGAAGADLCIVVIGESEKPYAEWFGDAKTLNIFHEDTDVLEEVKNANIPIVVILITGRPIIVTDQINDWDAFLVAWLPGTEGNGVADVIFGDYKPTGRLSFSWPKNPDQIPINIGDKNYDPLFPIGFGLTY